MTWGEFKRLVESKDVQDQDTVVFIDDKKDDELKLVKVISANVYKWEIILK